METLTRAVKSIRHYMMLRCSINQSLQFSAFTSEIIHQHKYHYHYLLSLSFSLSLALSPFISFFWPRQFASEDSFQKEIQKFQMRPKRALFHVLQPRNEMEKRRKKNKFNMEHETWNYTSRTHLAKESFTYVISLLQV